MEKSLHIKQLFVIVGHCKLKLIFYQKEKRAIKNVTEELVLEGEMFLKSLFNLCFLVCCYFILQIDQCRHD